MCTLPSKVCAIILLVVVVAIIWRLKLSGFLLLEALQLFAVPSRTRLLLRSVRLRRERQDAHNALTAHTLIACRTWCCCCFCCCCCFDRTRGHKNIVSTPPIFWKPLNRNREIELEIPLSLSVASTAQTRVHAACYRGRPNSYREETCRRVHEGIFKPLRLQSTVHSVSSANRTNVRQLSSQRLFFYIEVASTRTTRERGLSARERHRQIITGSSSSSHVFSV